ncbi:cytochrome c [Oceanomicrobium pacificus]|uniref:Cytochrome c domain-containing protein n=1 Tax=Oceanomicrobium pacificus TaxID=2692916 RepID=A0A6B0TYF0_9RHOB|nr:cytochrome c [Oceanomicrobium pacificus]MXU66448.1 hypothetical protein [Oceanomicrobium pacificus]
MRIVAKLMLVLILWSQAGGTGAQERVLVLFLAPELAEAGLGAHLAPRFGLKMNTRVTLRPDDGQPVAAPDQAALRVADGASSDIVPLFRDADGRTFGLAIAPDLPATADAARFRDWLTGPSGQAALTGFAGGELALVGRAPAAAPVAEVAGDAVEGERLALFHCGRCHVVSAANRFAGIGSTPSFAALRTFADWRDRFARFWELNPHPSFTQVEGITRPFPAHRPPHVAPVELTPPEVQAITAFASTIAPADLGAEISPR